MKLCVTELDFPAKFFLPKNWENGPKIGKKIGFFKFTEKLIDLYCYFNNFCIMLVGNGHGLLGLETPESAISQE